MRMDMYISNDISRAFLLAVLIGGIVAAAPAQAAAVESGSPPKSEQTVRLLLTGSSTMAPLMKEIGKRFQTFHAEVLVEVEAGGSGRGISDARQGKADIGMSSRSLTDAESDLYAFAIARDGICIIVHRNNPIKALTDRQVADIFTAKITNWKEVGGRDETILVFNPREGYSSVELFIHYFKLNYSEIKAHRVVGDNPTRISALAENSNGITFVSVGEAERKAQAGAPIKLLAVGGVAASSKNIRTGNYPISRPLTLVTKSPPLGIVKSFIDFALSPQVTDLILAHDFVPYLD